MRRSGLAVAAAAGLVLIGGAPASASPRIGHCTVVVAADGSGDFTGVQAAVDAAPSGSASGYTVLIKPGVYREVVAVPRDKPHVAFVGLSLDPRAVVITYDNANGSPKPGGGTYGTSGSASVTIDGDDFQAHNLTFENAFDEAAHPEITNHQAVAVLTRADRLVFDNVRFIGNQDTLYLNSASATTIGRALLTRCYVEGDVDFIFGRATAAFDGCVIKALDRGRQPNGFVTAASTTDTNPHGFLFTHCVFTSNAPAQTFYLGRPWHPSNDPNAVAQVTIRDSWLGAHITQSPWTDFGTWPWRGARYFEYHNVGPGAGVNADRPQLTTDQARDATVRGYLAGWATFG
jgi:pectinesterase